ncbi:MAG: zinc ABC transporter substrate-binding protein, partial [Proteobacteria bacterium]|nr:zinc ABC transporter substrate-binding protein [Pseudomonadota bacterium]
PVLLMQQMQSPHHYNMKPSERRLLSEARLIIWLGPQLESYLDKIIKQQKTAKVITAVHTQGLHLLRLRHKHSHKPADDGHSSNAASKPHEDGLTDRQIDPHLWLSIHNTIAISRHIAAALIEDAPANAHIYEKNLRRLLEKIEQTKVFVYTTLQSNKQPFIAFHDAFQYFEQENALNYIDSITFDEETAASLKHIRQINSLIKTQDIGCLVYQPPEPAIVRSLAERNQLKAVALDPLGQNIQASQNAWNNAWFEIMRRLALDFHQCLTP